MSNNYANTVELKRDIDKTGSNQDPLLEILLDAAASSIDAFCNRPDGFVADTTASARLYTGSGVQVQRIDETTEITLVAVKDSPTDTTYTSWVAGDWIPFSGDPKFPNFNSLPYTQIMIDPTGAESRFVSGSFTTARGFRPSGDVMKRGTPTVQITAKWGYATTVPNQIKQATLIQAARWYKRSQSSWADAIGNSEFGELRFVKKLDPTVEFLLVQGRFVKPAIGRR